MDNNSDADLANMQLVSKFNQGVCFLLGFIDVFSKNACVIPLKIKNFTYV